MRRNIKPVTAGGTTSGRVIKRAENTVAAALAVEQESDADAKCDLDDQAGQGVGDGDAQGTPKALVTQGFQPVISADELDLAGEAVLLVHGQPDRVDQRVDPEGQYHGDQRGEPGQGVVAGQPDGQRCARPSVFPLRSQGRQPRSSFRRPLNIVVAVRLNVCSDCVLVLHGRC